MVVILVIHCLIAAVLVGSILLQKKEGGLGGLGGGGSGGMGGMMSGRAKSDLLSRTTGILAALFFATSLTLAVIGARTTHQGPLVPATSSSGTVVPAAPATAPASGDVGGTAPVESAPESAPALPTTPTVPAGQ